MHRWLQFSGHKINCIVAHSDFASPRRLASLASPQIWQFLQQQRKLCESAEWKDEKNLAGSLYHALTISCIFNRQQIKVYTSQNYYVIIISTKTNRSAKVFSGKFIAFFDIGKLRRQICIKLSFLLLEVLKSNELRLWVSGRSCVIAGSPFQNFPRQTITNYPIVLPRSWFLRSPVN